MALPGPRPTPGWRRNDYQVEDQKLIAIHETYRFQTAADLARLITCRLARRFDTGKLAESLGVHRSAAQRIAYCLRLMGAVHEVGKQGNARLYQLARARRVA